MTTISFGRSSCRVPAGLALSLMLLLAGVGLAPGSPAPASAAPVAAVAVPDPALLGTAAEYAAGSCWEIKQERPTAPDGAYWLVTPKMAQPQQFYCDQTTDGGGWVLVGKGRNGWTMDDAGRGSPAALLTTAYNGGVDTHQHSAQLINQLLNGGRPVDLTEGIRVRRARNAAGTEWQEARFAVDTRQTGWSWAFGARFDVGSWSFTPGSGGTGTTSGAGGRSDYFGTGTDWARIRTVPTALSGYTNGFAYGDSVTGSNAAGSYLWASTDGGGQAIPVAQVYLRPKVRSDDAGFVALPDAGTPEMERRALHESDADPLPWGVDGVAGSTTREGSVEVQAFVEAHGRMYIGGNFRYVQRDEAGTGRVEQPFLAAFDLQTGQWVSSFRPVLNEQVRALEVLPSGAIVAGGDFTAANGAPATAVVALDPVTGATVPGFRLTVENRVTGGVVRIWDFELLDGQLYIGGDFTHLAGGGRTTFTYMRALARVRATDGRTEGGWNPTMMGTVIDLDDSADGSRIYAAGFFNTSRGVPTRKAAAVLTQFVTNPDGTVRHLADPLWAPVWSSTNKDYQQAIVEGGGHVWSGGSEHNVFGFDRTTFQRTSTTILHAKGDIQTFSIAGDVLYAGSHANNQYAYSDATTWSGRGPGGDPWTAAHTQHWLGAYDVGNGDTLPEFSPDFEMRSGVWATAVDSLGRLWVGGDMERVRTAQQAGRWAGGFARFSQRDVAAPATPGGFRVVSSDSGSITLAWNAVSDPAGVRYQILRDDRPVGVTSQTSITLPVSGAPGEVQRYFVRAADRDGNISASTPALTSAVPQDQPPVDNAVNLVARDAAWTWRYAAGAPGAGWNTVGFDDSGWQQAGTAPLGFAPDSASGQVTTDIDTFATTAERPITAYFRRTFQVADPGTLRQIVVTSVADDGAVFHVNGVEIGRQNMPAGTVTYQTYASTGRRLSVAEANPVVLEVPSGLLVAGTNVIAAETHVNYRATPDLTFYLSLDAVQDGE